MPIFAWIYAVVAAAAFAAGAASGAWINGNRWEAKYETLIADHATALTDAVEKARKEERDAAEIALSIRNQLVKRVRCLTTSASPAVPGAGPDAGVGDLRGSPVDRDHDYGPALRELLAAAVANNALAQQP